MIVFALHMTGVSSSLVVHVVSQVLPGMIPEHRSVWLTNKPTKVKMETKYKEMKIIVRESVVQGGSL